MKIVGYVSGTLVMALSASSIGIIPALILGVLVGAVINVLFFGNKPTNTPQAPQTPKPETVTATPESTSPVHLEDAETQFKLGQAFRLGTGVQKDVSQAFVWMQKSAEKGHADAQNMLGFMYQKGEGTPQDSVEAFHWYLLSAKQGNPTGQANLGFMYADKDSERHDYAEAAKWLLKSAEQGMDSAQEEMGEFYYWGRGVQIDYKKAEKWYRLAAAQGHCPEAERMLDVIQTRGLI
jgi:TPR repeat protein